MSGRAASPDSSRTMAARNLAHSCSPESSCLSVDKAGPVSLILKTALDPPIRTQGEESASDLINKFLQ